MTNRFTLAICTVVLVVVVVCATSASAQFTISGTVTDLLLAPVANVNILLFDTASGFPIGIPPTVTDAFGFYSIVGLPPGTYDVAFEPVAATKLLPRKETVVVVAANVGLDVALDPGHLLSGFVRDTTGVGIFDIDLQVEDDDTNLPVDTPGDNTDVTGFYDVVVPTGEFNLKWRSVGPTAQPWIPVEMRRVFIDTDTVIDVTMILGVFVTGTVKDQALNPVVNANLDFVDVATGLKIDAPGDNTDLTGTYLVHVPKLVYDIQVKPRPLDKLVAGEMMSVPVNGDTTVNFVLNPGFSISGTVRDPGALAVFNVDIDVSNSDTSIRLFTPFDKTDSLGHYDVIVPPGVLDIAYQPPLITMLAPLGIEGVNIFQDTIIDVTVENAIILSGSVKDEGGLAVQGVDIDAKDVVTGVEVPLVGDVTDVLGVFAVLIAPGTYHLEIEPAKITRLVAERLPAVPLAQNTSIPMTLVDGRRVSGTVTDSVGMLFPNVDVSATRSSDGFEIFTPGDNSNDLGRYEIIVPADSYTLTYRPDITSGVTDSVVHTSVTVLLDKVINAQFNISLATGIDDEGRLPFSRLRLDQNYPNPFNPSTLIRYEVISEGRIDLRIYDVQGALVRALFDGNRQPGRYEARWNGKDQYGLQVSSGVYFYRLKVGDESATRKMLLLK